MSEIQHIQVDKLWIVETSTPSVLEVRFIAPAGAEEDWHYQLYLNGTWADTSESSNQRAFSVHAQKYPQMFAVFAVEPAGRNVNLSALLPEDLRTPSWVCNFRMTQDTAFEPGDRMEIYHDDGSGTMDEQPALRWLAWPPAISHTGWGNATLLNSGFGIDGSNAPGMSAPFGIGPMGLGSFELKTVLPLKNSGHHNIRVLCRSSDGIASKSKALTFFSSAPPSRPGKITFISHNPSTTIAKFRIR